MLHVMTPKEQTPTNLTLASLRATHAFLLRRAAAIEEAIRFLEQSDADSLWVFKTKTLEKGMTCLSSFTESLQSSVGASAAGNPVTQDTRKTRG